MAAGLPVVAPAVGDVAAMVSAENRPYIVDPAALSTALVAVGGDPALRKRIGTANRARAAAEFDERAMISDYAALYAEAAGRPGALTGA